MNDLCRIKEKQLTFSKDEVSAIQKSLHPSSHWLLFWPLTDLRLKQAKEITQLRLHPEVCGLIPKSTSAVGDADDQKMRASGRYEGNVSNLVNTSETLEFKIQSLVYPETYLFVKIPKKKE